ncbi:venom acid phosphatase Acph-1-like [Diorhabda sublineata]|uniref:venom acid phosphatase Acph-1-like n=1 Tax=Diorhabda sublineata TaxID=1163346 RepID=UPI0024E0AE7F|nr:venom acid phosphatase Acph-1-like [Diorhabda sublineata]
MGISILLGCTVFLFCVFAEGSARFNNYTEEDYKKSFPNNEDQGTLKLINVMFRHGNRTINGIDESYPNDPYLNMTYFPYGLGQLTNAGKVKEYFMGADLRNRYDDFLGKYYYPELVEAISTNVNRTKMSLLLVLAGLFPPRKEDAVLGMSWQPIPYNFLPIERDPVLNGVKCPEYIEEYAKHVQQLLDRNKFKKYEKLFDYISQHSGLNITTIRQIYNLQFGLATEREFGLELPEWTNKVYPEPMTNVATEDYYIAMGTPILKRLAIGYFLKKLINDANDNIDDDTKLKTKIHLYSGHESTVARLLIALGIFEKHIPSYGSHVILELHEIEGVYGFKVFYQGWDGRGLRLMQIPGCEEFCPLDAFTALMQDFLPLDDDVCSD